MKERLLVCPACGSHSHLPLPVPHPARTVTSDGRVIAQPLQKRSCLSCGYGFHAKAPTADEQRSLYGETYDLGLRDRQAERIRAEEYARQILALLPSPQRFSSILEFGCGAGSLLAMLTRYWQCDEVVGVEPSHRLAEVAASRVLPNVRVVRAFAEEFASEAEGRFDLCLSVNVAEHTLHPEEFLYSCARTLKTGGLILLICPDGEQPGPELLFYDHISSFTTDSLMAFARRAGLELFKSRPLAGTLSGFCAHLLRLGHEFQESTYDNQTLASRRLAIFKIWQICESSVGSAFHGKKYALFGTGEFCDLLAAYCPSVVEGSAYFVVDYPISSMCYGRKVVSLSDYLEGHRIPLLAAVHERSWDTVSAKLSNYGIKVEHPMVLALESLQR